MQNSMHIHGSKHLHALYLKSFVQSVHDLIYPITVWEFVVIEVIILSLMQYINVRGHSMSTWINVFIMMKDIFFSALGKILCQWVRSYPITWTWRVKSTPICVEVVPSMSTTDWLCFGQKALCVSERSLVPAWVKIQGQVTHPQSNTVQIIRSHKKMTEMIWSLKVNGR